MTDYTEQINAGMAWLDANQPGWVQVFADDQAAGLHMDDCDKCVLGHVLGNYWDPRSPACVDPTDFRRLTSAEMGFSLPLPSGEPEWDRLGDAWREAIGKRLAQQGPLG